VCPLHAWKVNLESGGVERPAHGKDHCVTSYETRVEHGMVLLALPGRCRGGGVGSAPFSSRGADSAPFGSRGAGSAPTSSRGAGSAPTTERADPPGPAPDQADPPESEAPA
jgi:hypothetical protein